MDVHTRSAKADAVEAPLADPRLQEHLSSTGADGLVTADPGLVRMLTGFVKQINSDVFPFQLPAIAVAPGDRPARLVCSADHASESDLVHTYEGYTMGRLEPLRAALPALRDAVAQAALAGRRILVDGATVPVGLLGELGAQAVVVEGLLHLGAVKTAHEIEEIERSIRLCDSGHAAARAATVAGVNELDVWASVAEAVEREAGGRITINSDLLSGPRTAVDGGPPSGRVLEQGDLVLFDLAPCAGGMWGDSCATWAVGEPPGWAVGLHAAASESLRLGLSMLRPGTVAADVDLAMRAVIAEAGYEYPHHSGHGVGFRLHEEPRIVPGGTTVLEAGMVVALEPGGYFDRGGLRIEQVAAVTESGGRVLSRHSLSLS